MSFESTNNLIAKFRAITEKRSVSPESLGYILASIMSCVADVASNDQSENIRKIQESLNLLKNAVDSCIKAGSNSFVAFDGFASMADVSHPFDGQDGTAKVLFDRDRGIFFLRVFESVDRFADYHSWSGGELFGAPAPKGYRPDPGGWFISTSSVFESQDIGGTASLVARVTGLSLSGLQDFCADAKVTADVVYQVKSGNGADVRSGNRMINANLLKDVLVALAPEYYSAKDGQEARLMVETAISQLQGFSDNFARNVSETLGIVPLAAFVNSEGLDVYLAHGARAGDLFYLSDHNRIALVTETGWVYYDDLNTSYSKGNVKFWSPNPSRIYRYDKDLYFVDTSDYGNYEKYRLTDYSVLGREWAFRDRWLALSGLYGNRLITSVDESGDYSIKWTGQDAEADLFALDHLSYPEAVAICLNIPPSHIGEDAWGMGQKVGLPPLGYSRFSVQDGVYASLSGHELMEVLILSLTPIDSLSRRVSNATTLKIGNMPQLRAIIGSVGSSDGVHPIQFLNDGGGFPKLVYFRMAGLSHDFYIGNCPALSAGSVAYLIDKAINTVAISITVHPDIYDKLTDENNEEWSPILAAAAAKNITFVSA